MRRLLNEPLAKGGTRREAREGGEARRNARSLWTLSGCFPFFFPTARSLCLPCSAPPRPRYCAGRRQSPAALGWQRCVCANAARVFFRLAFFGAASRARACLCALLPPHARASTPTAPLPWSLVQRRRGRGWEDRPWARVQPVPSHKNGRRHPNSQPCLSRCLPAPQALPATAAASTSSSDSRWGGAVLVGGAAVGLAAALAPALAEDEADHGLHPPRFAWSHEGLFSSYDYASIRRGHQVYTQVREGSGERRVGERAKHKSRDSPPSPSPTRSAPPATLLGRCTTATWWACATRRRRPR